MDSQQKNNPKNPAAQPNPSVQSQPFGKDEVFKMIDDYFNQNYFSAAPKIPPHQHNQIDNLPIDPSNLLGFPIQATVPTDVTQNGTIRLYYDGTHYRIYARINNVWVGGTLS